MSIQACIDAAESKTRRRTPNELLDVARSGGYYWSTTAQESIDWVSDH
jgi:hypothetical protein